MKTPGSMRRVLFPALLLAVVLPVWADHGGGGGHGGGGHMGGGARMGGGGGQFHGYPGRMGGNWGGGGWGRGWNGGGYWGGRPWYRGDWGWGGWGWGMGLGLGWAAMADPWLGNPYPWGVNYGYYGAASPTTVVVNQTPVSPQDTTYLGSTRNVGPQNWFYCQSANGYYPYVAQCPEPWRAVPATPPGAIQQ